MKYIILFGVCTSQVLIYNMLIFGKPLPNITKWCFKNIYGTIYFVKVKFTIFFNIKLNTIIVWIPHPNKHMVMNIDSNYIFFNTIIIAQD
jgi:hypothetical protein